VTKTINQLIDEDFFFTLPYYCNAPEPYMRQKIKELVVKFLEENKETCTEPNTLSGIITVYQTTAQELLSLVDEDTNKQEEP
jgi:hypothetical protein